MQGTKVWSLFPESTQSVRGDKRCRQQERPGQLTQVPDVMRSSFFLAGKMDERVGSCGFELGFEGCIGKDCGERDE